MRYCVVPEDLAGKLFGVLSEFFADDPTIEVIVERRQAGKNGWRGVERRAEAVDVAPPELPRKVRRHAERLKFFGSRESVKRANGAETDRLIVRYQGGDQSALVELYQGYFDPVYAYCRFALRDPQEAEDLAQQVFIKVLQALPGYQVRPGQPFSAWLITITRNTVLDWHRRQGRLQLESPERIEGRREHSSPEQARSLLTWIKDADLDFFIERLPQAQRDVVVLRYLFGFENAEIARIIDRSERAVWDLHSRALTGLEQRLSAVGSKRRRSHRTPTLIRIKRAPVLSARRFVLAGPAVPRGSWASATSRLRTAGRL
jgi:RNA polymerase sigma-70 factor (ECF subfamily)